MMNGRRDGRLGDWEEGLEEESGREGRTEERRGIELKRRKEEEKRKGVWNINNRMELPTSIE
jgi:hypothetical protein